MFAFTKLAIVAIVATLPLATAAAANETHSISVRADDIDLTTTRGQKILALRIDRAARELCDYASDQLGHQVRKIERKCRDNAKATAWAAVKINKRLSRR